MSDWSGVDGAPTIARYLGFARHAAAKSPSYAALCQGVAADAELLGRLDTLPVPKRQPNLLLGAVRFLGGPVDAFPAFREFVLERWGEVSATMRARRTQTNEARRCTAFLPLLARLPQPLALLEVGASAGLCLQPDRYVYAYDSGSAVHRVGAGPVRLGCRSSGPVPLPARLPEVTWRAGLDLHPLDVRDEEDVRWLECLIWPEETERFEILAGAVAVAREAPSRIVTGDLRADLAALAAEAPAEATLVVYHSAALAYVSAKDRADFAAGIVQLAEILPNVLVWISNEAPGVVPGTDVDVAGESCFLLSVDRSPVARTGPHGEFVHWLG